MRLGDPQGNHDSWLSEIQNVGIMSQPMNVMVDGEDIFSSHAIVPD
jgi:hypothetical protein